MYLWNYRAVDLHRLSGLINLTFKAYTQDTKDSKDMIKARSALLRGWLGSFSWRIEGESMFLRKRVICRVERVDLSYGAVRIPSIYVLIYGLKT